jgi:hypothetical protein
MVPLLKRRRRARTTQTRDRHARPAPGFECLLKDLRLLHGSTEDPEIRGVPIARATQERAALGALQRPDDSAIRASMGSRAPHYDA